MAGLQGAAAYSKINPENDGISQGLQFWGQLESQRNANIQGIKERAQVRKEKDFKEWEDANKITVEDLKQKVTGYDTYDDIGREFTQKVADKYVEYNKKASDALKNGDIATKKQYELKMLKLKGTLSQVREMNESLSKRNEEYMKMVAEGKMSGVDKEKWEAENYAIQGGKNFLPMLDENDNLIVNGIKTLDDKTEEPFSISYHEMINGDWRPYEAVDLFGKTGAVNTILDSLGSYEEQKTKGLYKTTSKLWTPELDTGTKSRVMTMLKSDEVMSDISNQLNGTTKKKDFTEEERNAVADQLSQMVKTGYDSKYKEEFDKDVAGYKVALQKAAEDARHNKAAEANTRRGQDLTAKANKDRVDLANRELSIKEKETLIKNPRLNLGGETVLSIPRGKKKENITFNSYQLSDKDSKLQPFVVGAVTDVTGKVNNVTASSVSVSADGTLMTFTASNGKQYLLDHEKGDLKQKTLFESIESQMSGRVEANADKFGTDDPLGLNN